MFRVALTAVILFSVPALAQFSGIIRDQSTWPDSEVRVCWVAGSGSRFNACHRAKELRSNARRLSDEESRFMGIIEEVVTAEFSASRTGITFVGWEQCPAGLVTPDVADVVLFLKKNGAFDVVSGSAPVGPCIDQPESVGLLEVGLPTQPRVEMPLKLEDDVRIVALHEFGHLAGLFHEDEMDWKQTARDRSYGRQVSRYDRSSIMSYSFHHALLRKKGLEFTQRRGSGKFQSDPTIISVRPVPGTRDEHVSVRIGLSSGDVHALRCLYVFSPEMKKQRCHSRVRPWLADE